MLGLKEKRGPYPPLPPPFRHSPNPLELLSQGPLGGIRHGVLPGPRQVLGDGIQEGALLLVLELLALLANLEYPAHLEHLWLLADQELKKFLLSHLTNPDEKHKASTSLQYLKYLI